VQLFQRAQRANLRAAIGGVQKKWTYPKNLHRCGISPRRCRTEPGSIVNRNFMINSHRVRWCRKA
jgi:hypothetical protein